MELIARCGVARAVFREAVRLLEHQRRLAEMRRGCTAACSSGSPIPDPWPRRWRSTWSFEKVEPRELEDARRAIELLCVGRVAARISEADGRSRAFLAAEAARVASATHRACTIHVLVARLTVSPALHVGVQTLTDLTPRQQQPVGAPALSTTSARRPARSPRRLARDGGWPGTG